MTKATKAAIRRWLSLAVVCALPQFWLTLASLVYCATVGRMMLWRFPFWQWAEAFGMRDQMHWPEHPADGPLLNRFDDYFANPLWGLWLGAIAATVASLVILQMLFVTRRKTAISAFGDAARATDDEMRERDLILHRKPFW